MKPFVYGSVCSGVEAASLAWEPLGWRCSFVSEIEPFPSAVLAHRYPEIPNLGDFTQIRQAPEPIGLLVGGTPCQAFSLAGLRKGMDDERGVLALEFLRLAGRLRPDWLVWENVAGVLSSNGGRDFGSFLGGLVQLGYGFAYRVLDAQHFGVPQRRRRVFVVGRLGDWRPTVAVLFDRNSLSDDLAPSERPWEEAAEAASRRPRFRFAAVGGDSVDRRVVSHTLLSKGFDGSEDGTGRGTPIVAVPRSICWDACKSDHSESSTGYHDDLAPCLRSDAKPRLAVAYADQADYVVRKLTPRECERLQGFPDDWTLVPYRGKPAADSPRYKAIGNSMAVPCMAWIGHRIDAVRAALATA